MNSRANAAASSAMNESISDHCSEVSVGASSTSTNNSNASSHRSSSSSSMFKSAHFFGDITLEMIDDFLNPLSKKKSEERRHQIKFVQAPARTNGLGIVVGDDDDELNTTATSTNTHGGNNNNDNKDDDDMYEVADASCSYSRSSHVDAYSNRVSAGQPRSQPGRVRPPVRHTHLSDATSSASISSITGVDRNFEYVSYNKQSFEVQLRELALRDSMMPTAARRRQQQQQHGHDDSMHAHTNEDAASTVVGSGMSQIESVSAMSMSMHKKVSLMRKVDLIGNVNEMGAAGGSEAGFSDLNNNNPVSASSSSARQKANS